MRRLRVDFKIPEKNRLNILPCEQKGHPPIFKAGWKMDSHPEAALYLMLKMGYKRETIDLLK